MLVDVLISTDDIRGFHAANLSANPDHYPPWARRLGPGAVSAVNRCGGGVWFTTNVAANIPHGSTGDAVCVCDRYSMHIYMGGSSL